MEIQAPAEVKFRLIQNVTANDDNLLSITELCRIAGVSRSGYYNWLGNESKRLEREEADSVDFALILEAYRYRGYANREFRQHGARKILLTDITYLFYRNGKCYLSTIYDAYTKEILAYRLSASLKVSFVLETVDMLIAKHVMKFDDNAIIHSDQGSHYTSIAFIKKLRDNAPQESFFGHMKDEIAYEVSKCSSYAEVETLVDDWIDYYNNDRYQWDLLKLSPAEFYTYLQTGICPLDSADKFSTSRGAAPDPEV